MLFSTYGVIVVSNWIREFILWEAECAVEWTVVSRAKPLRKPVSSGLSVYSSHKSFADVVKLNYNPNLVPVPLVFNRIKENLVPPTGHSSSSKAASILVGDRPVRSLRHGGS